MRGFVLSFFILFPMLLSAQVKKVAILEAVDRTGEVTYVHKLMLRANLSKAITNTVGYEAYDRTDVDAIMNEQNFQRTGLVNDAQIKRLGEMTGAAFILVAEVAKADEQNLFITAKILNVETARTENSDNELMNMSPAEIQKGCERLASRLLTYSAPQSASSRGLSSIYVETTRGLNMKMVYVEGGTFQMGATSEQSGADDDERPVHNVTLDSYYIAATEVTQAQWQAVMGTSVQDQAAKAGFSGYASGPDYPMYYVSWEEAQTFCRKLSSITGKTYLLPTEAQWEYAARGGVAHGTDLYSGSYSPEAVAWYSRNSSSDPHPVGELRANRLGLYDMSGNVYEWCSDWYGPYSPETQYNPSGPISGSCRVYRGGSWFFGADDCRIAYRGNNYPSARNGFIGFRVVCIL